jgi:hypothetical protein
VALDRSFNQHHADIYVMLKMQQRLIAALQEAVFMEYQTTGSIERSR